MGLKLHYKVQQRCKHLKKMWNSIPSCSVRGNHEFTNIQAVILAAGKSSRFKTDKSKLLHKICGQKIIIYATRLLEKLHIPTTVVVGFQKEYVIKAITKQHGNTVTFSVQEEQKGTGHALACSRAILEQRSYLGIQWRHAINHQRYY